MYFIVFVVFLATAVSLTHQEEYLGKFIARLNSYHNQVSGEVYAVDTYTFLLKDFVYDGNGPDTFFWAGSTSRPGPQGYIVPDEHGTTNILKSYLNEMITITLPDQKSMTELKWLSVYDLTSQEAFGDIYIPEGFEPPSAQWLSELSRRKHAVRSGPIKIIDSKTIQVSAFNYDGEGGEVFFWVGLGPQPSSKGTKVPDEYGYLTKLRQYEEEDVTITLPGEVTIFEINWLSVYNVERQENYGSVVIPDGLNVPPSLVQVTPHENIFPNCEQLHNDLQVSWLIEGNQLTMEIAGQVGEDHYIAFGVSGNDTRSQMVGGDAVVVYYDGVVGHVLDYRLSAKTACIKVLGEYRGVCSDDSVNGLNDYQPVAAKRENGINIITFRRRMVTADKDDIIIPKDKAVQIIWAIGRLSSSKEPTFHHLYPKHNIAIQFTRNPTQKNCVAFTKVQEKIREPWGPFHQADPSLRTITARLGPTGGKRGYEGITGKTHSGLAWYLNGYLVPDIYLRRGVTYRILVEGGNNPHNPQLYHPFIITDEEHGGYDQLDKEAKREVRVLAGVEVTRRGKSQPSAAGHLCVWQHKNEADRRLDDDFPNFKRYRNSLKLNCEEEGSPAVLDITPNITWPDIVYYHSYSQPHMGWRFHIVDRLPDLSNSSFTVKSSYHAFLLFLLRRLVC